MKTQITPILLTVGLAGALPMVSCVAPYDSYGYTTVTTYSPGYRVTTLPRGYRTEVIGGTTYYYTGGSYFLPRAGGYVVVEAPRNSRYYDDYHRHHSRGDRHHHRSEARVITRLPDGYRVVDYRGTRYYHHGDRYYRPRPGGYVVVDSPF